MHRCTKAKPLRAATKDASTFLDDTAIHKLYVFNLTHYSWNYIDESRILWTTPGWESPILVGKGGCSVERATLATFVQREAWRESISRDGFRGNLPWLDGCWWARINNNTLVAIIVNFSTLVSHLIPDHNRSYTSTVNALAVLPPAPSAKSLSYRLIISTKLLFKLDLVRIQVQSVPLIHSLMSSMPAWYNTPRCCIVLKGKLPSQAIKLNEICMPSQSQLAENSSYRVPECFFDRPLFAKSYVGEPGQVIFFPVQLMASKFLFRPRSNSFIRSNRFSLSLIIDSMIWFIHQQKLHKIW